MVKQIVKINGMMCPMCEAHVNDAIRSSFKVESVKADRTKAQAEIVSEAALDADKLKSVVEATGYEFGGVTVEPAKKKGFLGLF
ncbi:MAG: cation transporter [Oscillospiraceae bacterium]|nr:cation transporter [Oscillospiraceae bacterium]